MRFFLLMIFLVTTIFANIGKISSMRGECEVIRASKTIKAFVGLDLHEKDVLKTKDKTKLQIIFKDQTIVTIGKLSTFKIDEYIFDMKNPENTKANLGFLAGSFKSITGKIGKIAPQKFKLRTKTATIGIRGTTVVGDQESVACTRGEITVSSQGVTQVVPAGMFTQTPPNAPPTEPEPYEPGSIGDVDKVPDKKDDKKNDEKNDEENDKKDDKEDEQKDSKSKDDKDSNEEKEDSDNTDNNEDNDNQKDADNTENNDDDSTNNDGENTQDDGSNTDNDSTDSQDDTVNSDTDSGSQTSQNDNTNVNDGESTGIEQTGTSEGSIGEATGAGEIGIGEVSDAATEGASEAAGAAGEAAQAATEVVAEATEAAEEATQESDETEIIEKIEAEAIEEVTVTEEVPTVEEATDTTTTPVATPTTQVTDIASTVFDTGVTVDTTGLTQVSSYSDSYLDYGYWNDSSSNPVHTYLSGVVTSSDFVDQMIQTGGTATYSGGLSAIVTDAQSIKSAASGTAELNLNFDTQTFTGTIDVNSAAFKADVAGSVSKYGFDASSVTKNAGSSADVTGGSMSGNFYGSSAEAVGGNFGLSSSDAGSVSGVFGLTK